jgi:hypothetical protein
MVFLFWFPNISVGICGVALAVAGSIVSVLEFKGWKRITLVGVFLVLGVGEVVAIRQADTAHVREIKDTAQQVAAETSTRVSADVTKAVTEQYKQIVSDQQKKIDLLQAKLDEQAKDVKIIKGSNIVTGKKPVPVEVMNPGSPPGETLPNLRWTQEDSTPSSGHPVTTVSFQIDGILNLPAFVAVCDRPCEIISGTVYRGLSQGVLLRMDSNVAGFLFNTPRPLTPGFQCRMALESLDDKPIKVTSFRILHESEIPMALK